MFKITLTSGANVVEHEIIVTEDEMLDEVDMLKDEMTPGWSITIERMKD